MLSTEDDSVLEETVLKGASDKSLAVVHLLNHPTTVSKYEFIGLI